MSDTSNMISELLNYDGDGPQLSIREIEFLENVQGQSYKVTPAQEEWLISIWDKVFK